MASIKDSNTSKTYEHSPLSHNIKRMDNNGLNIYYIPEVLDTPKLQSIPEEASNGIQEVDNDSDSGEDTQELYKTNIFVYCIHCSSMIMIMSDNDVPLTILSDKNAKNKCCILGTTCRQCTKKYTPLLQNNKGTQEYSFEKCFKMASISSKMLETSHICRIAKMAIKRDIIIMKDNDGCLLYEKRNTILSEINDKCYVIGIKTDESVTENTDNVFMVFLRGGFL